MPLVNPGTSPAIPGITTIASVSVFSDVRALTGGIFPVLQVLGGTTVGDGQDGVFYWSALSVAADDSLSVLAPSAGGTGRWIRIYSGFSLSSGASHVGVVQSGTAARGTVASKLQQFVNVDDAPYSAVGDGITDDTAAFTAAIAALAGSGNTSGGGRLYLSRRTYKINSDLAIKFQIQLEGDGGIDNYGSRLLFADGKGIHVYHSSDSGTGTDGSWSIIRNLRVASAGGSTACHGIYISGHGVKVENVSVSGFKTNGINIVANGGVGNANNWRLENVRITSCGQHGLFVDGGDSNAGVATLVDASSNAGWGIYDSSFLGNTYTQCHTATNTSGAYKTDDNNAANVLLGCYSESDQAASSLVYPTLVIGGQHAAGFTAGTTAPVLTAVLGNARWTTGAESNMTSGASTVLNRIGGDASNGDILYSSESSKHSLIWRLKYKTNDLQFNYNNADANTAFYITGASTVSDFGTGGSGVPYVFWPQALAIGTGSNARRHDYQSAAPSSALHARGEIAWNTTHSIGAPAFWKATATGTPGTWVAERNRGTFTAAAAATTTINDTNVTATSVIVLMPTNAAAAALQNGAKSLYVSTRTGATSFVVSTADGTNPAGTETFEYMLLN